MFEFYRSPDGHFGLVEDVSGDSSRPSEVSCPTCGARYRLLARLDPMGQPVEKQ